MKCKYICLLLSPLLLHKRITGYQETQDIVSRFARPASSATSILEQELISLRELYFSFSYFQLQTCGLRYWPCELQPPEAMGAFSSLRLSLCCSHRHTFSLNLVPHIPGASNVHPLSNPLLPPPGFMPYLSSSHSSLWVYFLMKF